MGTWPSPAGVSSERGGPAAPRGWGAMDSSQGDWVPLRLQRGVGTGPSCALSRAPRALCPGRGDVGHWQVQEAGKPHGIQPHGPRGRTARALGQQHGPHSPRACVSPGVGGQPSHHCSSQEAEAPAEQTRDASRELDQDFPAAPPRACVLGNGQGHSGITRSSLPPVGRPQPGEHQRAAAVSTCLVWLQGLQRLSTGIRA